MLWKGVALGGVILLLASSFLPWTTFFGFFSFSLIDIYRLGIGPSQKQILEATFGQLEVSALQDTLLAMVMTVVFYPIAVICGVASLALKKTSFLGLASGALSMLAFLSTTYAIESLKAHLAATVPEPSRQSSLVFLSGIRVDIGAYVALTAGIVLGASYFIGRTTELTETTPPVEVEKPVETTHRPRISPMMMYCRECGSVIPRDSKFCKECGTKLV